MKEQGPQPRGPESRGWRGPRGPWRVREPRRAGQLGSVTPGAGQARGYDASSSGRVSVVADAALWPDLSFLVAP